MNVPLAEFNGMKAILECNHDIEKIYAIEDFIVSISNGKSHNHSVMCTVCNLNKKIGYLFI